MSAHFSHLFLKFFCFSAFLRFGKRENRVQKAFCFPTPSHSSVPLVASWGRDQWPYPHLCTHPPPGSAPGVGGSPTPCATFTLFSSKDQGQDGSARTRGQVHAKPRVTVEGMGRLGGGWRASRGKGSRAGSQAPCTHLALGLISHNSRLPFHSKKFMLV